MTSTTLQTELDRIRRLLRERAGEFLQRFYRHDVLVARAVRGMQLEAVAEFDREVTKPLLREVGASLASFSARGADVTPDRFPQLRQAIDEAQRIVQRGIEAVRRLTEERTAHIGRTESAWVAQNAAKTTGEPVAPAAVDRAVRSRYWLGDSTEKWFEKFLARPIGEKVRETVVDGLQNGQTVDDIVRRITGTKTQTGIVDAGRQQVAMLVRTAATAASSTARGESFRALGVTEWTFVATLDSKTSIQCAANDGKVFPVGKGPVPPLHPNCRSNAVPYLGQPIGTRASIDGQVPAATTFEEWLTDRTQKEQDEVLGKTKAAAWRAGSLSLRDMLGRDLQPLTLAELGELDRL